MCKVYLGDPVQEQKIGNNFIRWGAQMQLNSLLIYHKLNSDATEPNQELL